jgi:ribosome-associated protein
MTGKAVSRKSRAVPKKLTGKNKALLAVSAGQAIKAVEPVVIKVGELVDYTDYFVIMHGESMRQVMAIAENIVSAISETQEPGFGIEGEPEGRWVVIDWGDVVVHVFLRELRQFYELEKLWADASRVSVPG